MNLPAWPFADPRNVAVFTTADVIDRGLPIVHVTHDEDDGGWQFHSAKGVPEPEDQALAEARIIALEEIVKQDPTVAELADLPLGWRALRKRPGSEWRREQRA